jgi:hypothetical protein
MKDILERYNLQYSNGLEKMGQPSLELQVCLTSSFGGLGSIEHISLGLGSQGEWNHLIVYQWLFQLEHGNNIRLSKEVADKSQQLRYIIILVATVSFFHVLTDTNSIAFDDRQARGEDLQGLNLDELQKLEKKLEAGLRRVLETKVCARLPISFLYVTITCRAI